MMKSTVVISLLTVLAIGSLVGGLLAPSYIEASFEKGLADQLVIDSKNHPGYDDWITNTDEGDTPKYRNYYLFNLTNTEDYLGGATPEFEELGPYAFRQYDTKFNVVFENDLVSYAKFSYFVFDQEQSFVGASLTDSITNINTGYLGILGQLGSETNLMVSFVGPTVGNLVQGLTTDFVDGIVFQATPESIQGFRDQITGSMGNLFYTQWANGSVSDVDLDGDTADDLNIGLSNVTLNQALNLFDENNSMSFSNLSGFTTWMTANESVRDELALQFGISTDQAILIQQWLSTIMSQVVPYLLVDQFAGFGVDEVSDLGYLQWTSSVLTSGTSLRDLDGSIDHYPEFWSYADHIANSSVQLDLDQAKSLFEGPMNITVAANAGTFLYMLNNGDFSGISTLWGLNSSESVAFSGYLQYVMGTFVSDFLTSMQNIGGGLITTYNVTEWLFKNTDPFISLLAPDAADTSFFNNQTSADDPTIDPASTYNTGSSDLNFAGNWVADQGESVITDYAENITVRGSNGEFFGLGISADDELVVYSDDLKRTIPLEFVEESKVEGIDTLRFTFADSALQSGAENPDNVKFHHHASGFFNLTDILGLQILLSNPRFYGVDESTVDVVLPVANREDHTSFLDIEPTTGLAISAAKRLQFNIVVNATDVFYTSLPDAVIPLMWIEEAGALSGTDAAEFKSSIETYLMLRDNTFPGLSLVAGIFMVSALIVNRKYR